MPDAGWFLRIAQNTGILWARATFGTQNATSITTEALTLGQWHHVAAVLSPLTDKWHIAIDGVWCTYSQDDAAVGGAISDATIDLLHGAQHTMGVPDLFLTGDIQWARLSNGWRYLPGLGFTPPAMCAPPAPDASTVEIWAMDEGSGLATAATVNPPANDGTGVDIDWGLCT